MLPVAYGHKFHQLGSLKNFGIPLSFPHDMAISFFDKKLRLSPSHDVWAYVEMYDEKEAFFALHQHFQLLGDDKKDSVSLTHNTTKVIPPHEIGLQDDLVDGTLLSRMLEGSKEDIRLTATLPTRKRFLRTIPYKGTEEVEVGYHFKGGFLKDFYNPLGGPKKRQENNAKLREWGYGGFLLDEKKVTEGTVSTEKAVDEIVEKLFPLIKERLEARN